jgi:hypothetical protein
VEGSENDQNPNTITPVCRLQDAKLLSVYDRHRKRMDAWTHAQ